MQSFHAISFVLRIRHLHAYCISNDSFQAIAIATKSTIPTAMNPMSIQMTPYCRHEVGTKKPPSVISEDGCRDGDPKASSVQLKVVDSACSHNGRVVSQQVFILNTGVLHRHTKPL